MRKAEFISNIEVALEGFKGLKLDVVGYDNKYFMVYIKKKDKSGKKTTKNKVERPPNLTIKASKDK